jgi:hypothetical protein
MQECLYCQLDAYTGTAFNKEIRPFQASPHVAEGQSVELFGTQTFVLGMKQQTHD